MLLPKPASVTVQKKVCMLGGYGVGKTSLVNQFVRSTFSVDYLTTIGACIEKKRIQVHKSLLELIIWDLAGDDHYESIRKSYLKGASGYLLVVDGTREESLAKAREIRQHYHEELEEIPFTCVLNKSDLRRFWAVTDEDRQALRDEGWKVIEASATSKESVDGIFQDLGDRILLGESPNDLVLERNSNLV